MHCLHSSAIPSEIIIISPEDLSYSLQKNIKKYKENINFHKVFSPFVQ